jgi:hypothetical protein
MKIIFYIEISNQQIYWWIQEGNIWKDLLSVVWIFNIVEKSKLQILEHRNDWLVFSFVQKIVLVGISVFYNIKSNILYLGTLQYMSPDVVLVPPMGYGPEVSLINTQKFNSDYWYLGWYLECWLYSNRNGNG